MSLSTGSIIRKGAFVYVSGIPNTVKLLLYWPQILQGSSLLACFVTHRSKHQQEPQRDQSLKPQAKGSGMVYETQKWGLAFRADSVPSKLLDLEMVVPVGSRLPSIVQRRQHDVVADPIRVFCGHHKGNWPRSFPFHVLLRLWVPWAPQKPNWNWKWQGSSFLDRKSRAQSHIHTRVFNQNRLWWSCSHEWEKFGSYIVHTVCVEGRCQSDCVVISRVRSE